MRIAYIIPGSGGSFYCENCMRDDSLAQALDTNNCTVITVPMYLPSFQKTGVEETPIFYGAVELYLREKYKIFRKIPKWISRFLNSRPVLDFAARIAGSTKATGLEDLTISMLQGTDGNSAEELKRLSSWIKDFIKPDIIHLSNALLLGIGSYLKKTVGVPVVCSLQDEHTWIDPMHPQAAAACWQLMKDKAAEIDCFYAVSDYYKKIMQERMNIIASKLMVIPPGIDTSMYAHITSNKNKPVIGFLSRFEKTTGLDLLIEAVHLLKKDYGMKDISVLCAGGMTADDKQYVKKVKKLIKKYDLEKQVIMYEHFHKEARFQLLSQSSVLCVPRTTPEAFGVFLLEAFASGVPAAEPDIGAFPEIIKKTGGGELFHNGNSQSLAGILHQLLTHPDKTALLGEQARKSAHKHFNISIIAKTLEKEYQRIILMN